VKQQASIAWHVLPDKQLLRQLQFQAQRTRHALEQGDQRAIAIRMLIQLELGIAEVMQRGMQVGLFDVEAFPARPASGVEPLGRVK
jgi:hypothetical protein